MSGHSLSGNDRQEAAPGLPIVTLIGYPLRSTGRAEHVRALRRALAAAGVTAGLYSADGYDPNDPRIDVEFLSRLSEQICPGIRIYSLNGDEIAGVIEAMEARK